MPSRAALIISLVLSIIMVVFALANTHTIEINFLLFTTPAYPVALTLIVTFAMGVLVGILATYATKKQKQKRAREGLGTKPSPPDPPSPGRSKGSSGPTFGTGSSGPSSRDK